MTSLDRILVALDFEPPSLAALDWAIELGARLRAKVTVLHTFEVPVVGILDSSLIAAPEHVAQALSAAEKQLSATLDPRRSRGVELDSLLRQGETSETIHAVADELDAGLIVVGTHGRKGISHALLGSMAEKTMRSARRPVVVVHAPMPLENADDERKP